MPVRSSRLMLNHSAGCLADTPFNTVHHRPPKNIAPSSKPASNARASCTSSFIFRLPVLVYLPILVYLPVFFGDPMPRIQAADDQADYQQRECPGMDTRVTLIQPNTQRRTEQGWHRYRPADQAHHAQA